MLTKEQFLLTKLAEEAAEIAQMALKTVQFGLDEVYQKDSNKKRLCDELSDLSTLVQMLNKDHALGFKLTEEYYYAKRSKIEHYWKYSATLGKAEDPDYEWED